jgi:hypothetical protein
MVFSYTEFKFQRAGNSKEPRLSSAQHDESIDHSYPSLSTEPPKSAVIVVSHGMRWILSLRGHYSHTHTAASSARNRWRRVRCWVCCVARGRCHTDVFSSGEILYVLCFIYRVTFVRIKCFKLWNTGWKAAM